MANRNGFTAYAETYALTSKEDREKHLELSYVRDFIHGLNAASNELGDKVWNAFVKGYLPEDWQVTKELVIKLGGMSGPILSVNPGDPTFMDLLYDNSLADKPLDKFLTNSKGGQAVFFRKMTLVDKVEEKLTKIATGNHDTKAKVLNLGSGFGHDTIELVSKNETIRENVSFVNVDIDPVAILEGEKRLASLNFHSNVSFMQKDMLKLKMKNEADMAWIIGILCPLSASTCTRYLKIVKKFMKPNGLVYGACVTDKMLDDLFTCFILENILNWKLCYRSETEVRKIFEDAGYHWQEDLSFSEVDTRMYQIGVGAN
jgi:cyclopropane fatty-acyl-phospholipid synthase-like methyltransferase